MIEYYIVSMAQFANFMMSLLLLAIVGVVLWATYDWEDQVQEMEKESIGSSKNRK